MRVHSQDKLVKLCAGVARSPRFMRRTLLQNDHSGRLVVGGWLVAEFDSPQEEDEFFEMLMDAPREAEKEARGWRSGGG